LSLLAAAVVVGTPLPDVALAAVALVDTERLVVLPCPQALHIQLQLALVAREPLRAQAVAAQTHCSAQPPHLPAAVVVVVILLFKQQQSQADRVAAAQTLPIASLARQATLPRQLLRKATTAAQAILIRHLMVAAAVELLRLAVLAALGTVAQAARERRLQSQVHQ
jgi:hypothetical protein